MDFPINVILISILTIKLILVWHLNGHENYQEAEFIINLLEVEILFLYESWSFFVCKCIINFIQFICLIIYWDIIFIIAISL